MAKIKSTLKHRANQTITLPDGLGDVTFNESLEAEVTDEVASKIILMDIGIEAVEESKLKQNKTPIEEDEDDFEFNEESLSKLGLLKLREIAIKSGFPSDEFEKLKKQEFVSYILSKISELSNEGQNQ